MAVRKNRPARREELEFWVRSWSANEMLLILDLVGGNCSDEGNMMPTKEEKKAVHELWFDCNEPYGGPDMKDDIKKVLGLSDKALAVMRTVYDAHVSSLDENELFRENFHLKNGPFYVDSDKELGDRWRLVFYLSDEREVGAGFMRSDKPVLVSYPDGELVAFLSGPDEEGRYFGTQWYGFKPEDFEAAVSIGKVFLCNVSKGRLDEIDVSHSLVDNILKRIPDPAGLLKKYDDYWNLGDESFTDKEVISVIDRIAEVWKSGGDFKGEAEKGLLSLSKGVKAVIFETLCPNEENWLRKDLFFSVDDIVRVSRRSGPVSYTEVSTQGTGMASLNRCLFFRKTINS